MKRKIIAAAALAVALAGPAGAQKPDASGNGRVCAADWIVVGAAFKPSEAPRPVLLRRDRISFVVPSDKQYFVSYHVLSNEPQPFYLPASDGFYLSRCLLWGPDGVAK